MQLRQLHYFVTLVEHLHFGRAAEAVHVTQPSLSQQIRALEDSLGTVLFERSKRHVALTPDGETLLPYARKILALAADVRTEIADRSRRKSGRIRLGATPTLSGHLLPRLLPAFHRQHPRIELTITEDGSDRLARELDEGRLDLALLVEDRNFTGHAFESLFQEEIVAALPAGHKLSRQKTIHLASLRDDGFILYREGHHLRGLTLEACRSVGLTPRVTVSGTDVHTALRLVAVGLGVALVPKLVADATAGIAAVSISEPQLSRGIGVAWNPRRYVSEAASALRSFLRQTWV